MKENVSKCSCRNAKMQKRERMTEDSPIMTCSDSWERSELQQDWRKRCETRSGEGE